MRWGGPPDRWPENWRKKILKKNLLEPPRLMYPPPIYKIQKIADKFETNELKLKILFLPVAHPELNPIEMVWGIIKRKIAECNLTFNLNAVEDETRTQISNITAATFQNYENHSLKEEDRYRQIDAPSQE